MASPTLALSAVSQRRTKVQHIMGTVISIDVRDAEVPEQAIDRAFEWFVVVDQRFSPFKADSEISRIGRGELMVNDAHMDVAEVLAICEEFRSATDGAFNAWRARTDGRLDPSGVVKGWAVDRAVEILAHEGASNFSINAGGDVVVRGEPEVGRKWRIGIRHPGNRHALAAVVEGWDLAIATSGTYERGNHILDARTGEPSPGLLSLTVAGPSMTLADAYATAGFALGESGLDWLATQKQYAVFGIMADSRIRFNDRFGQMSTPRKVS
jgi:thiamine biosynthesis lipoprotein